MVSETQREYEATQNNNNLMPEDRGVGGPKEKDFSNGNGESGYHLDSTMDPDHALSKIRTTGSLSISPELFEKIYLSPQNRVAGDLRKTFGNPTPLALAGFLLSLSPLSCDLMGWRGAGGNGAAGTGTYFFFGGLLMITGAVGEWIIGNTFPFVVFGTFGAFWLSFGATLQPLYGAWAAYSPEPLTDPGAGLKTVGFNSSFAFFQLFMGVLCFVFFCCSFRTNVVFMLIFLFLIFAFGCLAGAFWQISNGNLEVALQCQIAAGALTFIVDLLGWWIFSAIMLASLDFPFQLPVGDLSHLIKGASQKAKERNEYEA